MYRATYRNIHAHTGTDRQTYRRIHACVQIAWLIETCLYADSSVVPMIDYNQKSFIYMQPIDDQMEFQGIDYNRKNPQVKEFHFYLTPNANFYSILL